MEAEKNVKDVAREYIDEIRDREIELIEKSDNPKTLKLNLTQIQEMEKEIKNVKKNRKIKLFPQTFKKTLSGGVSKLFRFIRRNARKLGKLTVVLLSTIAIGFFNFYSLFK